MSWIGALAGGAVLLVLLIAVVLAIVAALRSRREGEQGTVVLVALILAVATAAIAAIGGTIAVVATFVQPHVPITVPVTEYWPQLPDGATVEGMTAARVSGGFTSAELLVEGLSVGTRTCWAIAQALGWFVPGAIAALVAVGCRQLRAGRPFAPVLGRMTMLTAIVVMVGGFASQVLGDVAGSLAAREVLEWTAASGPVDVDPAALLPSAALAVGIPFWPIGAGLGLAALAAIFQHGDRLERDAVGLV